MKRRLALREIHDNVTVTAKTLTAWFVLGPQRWSFMTDAQREALVISYARRLAALAGHRVHIRVTSRPYPAADWARVLDANTPNPLPGWGEHLEAAQKALYTATLADKVVHLGVELPVKRKRRARGYLAGVDGARAEIRTHEVMLGHIRDIVSGVGMDGRPATAHEVEWLMHRSVRLGLPAPATANTVDAPWLSDDVHAFTDGVTYTHRKFGPTVEVHAAYPERDVSRHVAVLAVGRMGAFDIPQVGRDPWMQATDRLGFPVEWASTVDIIGGAKIAKDTARKRLGIRDMQGQFHRHRIEEPLALDARAALARRIENEVTEGDAVVATRAYGWHRIAVSAATEQECLDRVKAVKDLYEGQQVAILHPRNLFDGAAQLPLLTEFIPGEPLSTTAYKRGLPVLMFAAGLPHVTATVGDTRGPHMGHTAGTSRRAFMLDPHYPMEVLNRSGLIPIVAGLGGGKSVLIGKFARESAARGIVTTLLDPSGPLANLCNLPALRAHAQHIDLVNGDAGVLNPYAVIREPLRENYDTEDEWLTAVKVRTKARKSLAADVVRMLLPAQVDALPGPRMAVSNAIREVGGSGERELWDVVKALDKQATEDSVNVANLLRDAAEMPQSELFFPNHVHDLDTPTDTLLVLTMAGLQLPAAGQPREAWSTEEQVAVPLLHLAAHYTTQRAYGRPKDEPKMVGLDEVRQMQQWGSGRALFTRLATDSRKFNIAALLASQGPRELLDLGIAHLSETAFVGRIEDYDTATEALRFLRVSEGAGYEKVIAGLSLNPTGPREFVVRDAEKNVEKVRIDLSGEPEVLEHLATTPGRHREAG